MEKKEICKGMYSYYRHKGDNRVIEYIIVDGKKFLSEESVNQELDRAREERTEELRQAFYDTFYQSGELWFDYLFEDDDTETKRKALEVVGKYWKELLSKLTTK